MKRAVTYHSGTQSAWLGGNHYAVLQAVETVGCPSQYRGTERAIPIGSLENVLAALQAAGVPTVEQLG